MKNKSKFIHNLLIILGAILLVEVVTFMGIALSALWYLEYGV